jgi:hypothetical protein
VRSSPLANTRPLDEGWFVVATDGRASIQPGTASASESDLGTVEWEIWATPPSSETPLDVDPSSEPEPETSPTVEDAVARFEEFAHAYGSRDVATACAIGGPAIVAGGGGDLSCEEAARVGMDLASAEQMAALRELEIDPSTVRQTAPDRVEIPPAPPLSDDPANDPPTVLEHDGTDWFVVD